MAAYWVVCANVLDEEKLRAYSPLASETVKKYGGQYLARGGECAHQEGATYARNVIVQWPDMATAQQAYASAEYTQARAILADGIDRVFTIVDGV